MSNDLIKALAAEQGLDHSSYWKTICGTVIPGQQTTEQVLAFLAVANQYGLNPLTKEIYAFPAKGGIQPIVSVDGWLKLANKHPQFNGLITDEVHEGGNVLAVRCTIHRKDRDYPTVATEYMSECRRPTEPWKQWPVRMLTNKAMIQAIRRAFSFAGIYDPDEGQRIAEAREAEAEFHTIESISEVAQAATTTRAKELKDRLAAEKGEPAATSDEGADASGPASPGVAPSSADPDDDFGVMDFDALKAYATSAKSRMSAGQKKAAAAAVEDSDQARGANALRSLFRKLAGEAQS